MKNLLLLSACFFSCTINAQDSDSERLIYSEEAREALIHIVDSLNLEFSVSESKPYKSCMQGRGDYFFMNSTDAFQAIKDMESGFTFNQMAAKYPYAQMQPDVIVERLQATLDGKPNVIYAAISLGELIPSAAFTEDTALPSKGWVFSYDIQYSALTAYYLPDGLSSPELPERYARLVQYVDHLVPRDTQVYFDYSWECTPPYAYEPGPKMKLFKDYHNEKLQRPIYTELNPDNPVAAKEDRERFRAKLSAWEDSRRHGADSLMQSDAVFKKLFRDALAEANDHLTVTDEEFEEYAEAYASKEEALYFKRCRKVMNTEATDSEPRRHMMNIARLAAETRDWQLYLAAQFEILSERLFFRPPVLNETLQHSFVRELEAINVNAVEFLLGHALRTADKDEGLTTMATFKLAMPIVEAFEREVAENILLDMIADRELDEVNRATAYRLFCSYNRLLPEMQREKNNRRLEQAEGFLPESLLITKPD